MKMRIGLPSRLAFVLILVSVVAVESRSSPQAMPAQGQQEQKDADNPTPQQLTDRILNSALPMSQRVADYGKLTKFEPKDRDAGLATLVRSSDESIAAMAASELIRERSPNVTQLVVPQIQRWSASSQLAVLQTIRFSREEQAFLDIPRALMKQAPSTSSVDPNASPLQDPLEEAALILTQSSDPADRSLLRIALLSRPQSRVLWLAAAKMGDLNSQESSLAASVYNDLKLPLEVRVAAAAALAPLDSRASTFVVNEIESFLNRFATRETGQILLQAGQDGKKELYYLREHLALVGTLRFLNTADAEKLTFRFLDAKNEQVRMTIGLVAAVRWPQRLLAAGREAFTSEEYEDLMAYTSMLHPDLTSPIIGRISKQSLDNVTTNLMKSGAVGMFGLPAVIVLD